MVDTDSTLYMETVKICAQAPETDGLLLICSPAGTMDTLGLAQALVPLLKTIRCPVFTAWIGGDNVNKARQVFNQAGIVTYDSAEQAVRAFKNLYHYGQNIKRLHEIPVRKDVRLLIDRKKAQKIVWDALAAGEKSLLEPSAKELLAAYGIPVNETQIADSPEMALSISEKLGYPVVLKICSPQISHKSDCSGVVLNLETPEAVKTAYARIMEAAMAFAPGADIKGVTVQTMLTDPDYELIIGAKKDVDFGPVIVFGMGGVMTEVFEDIAMGLPPLNHSLARQMIRGTKISRVLNGFRHIARVSETQLEELLIRTGRLVTDFPEITDLDINPFMVKDGKIFAVDARVHIAPCKEISPRHLIISSYPWEYESRGRTMDGHDFFVRPIRPDDADMMIDHFNSLSKRSVYMRFFSPLKQLSKQMLIRLTQIDYDREIALVALMGEDPEKIIGVSRIIGYFDGSQAEFAVTICDDWQGQGIGAALLVQCLAAARNQGMKKIMGFVLAENTQMLKLGKKLGFKIKRVEESSEFELTIDL